MHKIPEQIKKFLDENGLEVKEIRAFRKGDIILTPGWVDPTTNFNSYPIFQKMWRSEVTTCNQSHYLEGASYYILGPKKKTVTVRVQYFERGNQGCTQELCISEFHPRKMAVNMLRVGCLSTEVINEEILVVDFACADGKTRTFVLDKPHCFESNPSVEYTIFLRREWVQSACPHCNGTGKIRP